MAPQLAFLDDWQPTRQDARVTPVSETIGERLKRLRSERGLSQRAIAARGVSYAYISRIELGERVPSMKALRVLSRNLGVTPHYLETGIEQPDTEARELRLGEAELTLRLDLDDVGAEVMYREVLTDAERAGDVRDMTLARIGLGAVAAQRGDHLGAIEVLRDAVREPWVPPTAFPDAWATLGLALSSTGDGPGASELFRDAAASLVAHTPVNWPALVRFSTYLSYALADLGELDEARKAIDDALGYAAHADDPYSRMRLYWSHARLSSAAGDHDAARSSITRAIGLLETTEDTMHLGRAHLLAAEIAIFDDDPYVATEHLRAAEILVGEIGDLPDRAWLKIERAIAFARTGGPGTAIDEATEAIDMLARHDDAELRGYAQWALGEALSAAGTTKAARSAFTRASDLIPPDSRYASTFLRSWARAFPTDAETLA